MAESESGPALPAGARETAHACAAAAGMLIRTAAAGSRATVTKGTTSSGRRDVVTETDAAVEEATRALIGERFPAHAVLGEEGGAAGGDAAWRWIVDPIDGTRNFALGVPLFAYNLALYHAGVPRLALTLDPLREELFYAEAGAGATLNGVPLQTTAAATLADAVVAIDLGYEDALGSALLGAAHALFPRVQALRLPGTVALGMAYVAAGRFDAYLHPSANLWDFAPGVLLVREAGGLVSGFDGLPTTTAGRSIVATGTPLHGEALALARRGTPAR